MDMDRSVLSPRWASGINILLAIWLILSPWIVGFSGTPAALWNTLILGVLVLVAACMAMRSESTGPSWINLLFGIWLIVSPFFLAYGHASNAADNDVICGFLVGIYGLAVALTKSISGRRMAA